MYRILLNGREIEVSGSRWKIAEKDRINLGAYLLIELEIKEIEGTRTLVFRLRVKMESMQSKTDDEWILDAIRASLQNLPPSGKRDLWL